MLGGIGGICFLAATFSSYSKTPKLWDTDSETKGAGGPISGEASRLSQEMHNVGGEKSVRHREPSKESVGNTGWFSGIFGGGS